MPDSKVQQVKSVVLIPKYFKEIIVPELKDYYRDYPADFDVRPMVKCPLHVEDTPSFRWYSETNTFFCFGCRTGGDVIHLHRKFMKNVKGIESSFSEAVNFLYSYFVLGREDINRLIAVEVPVEVESSNVEQLRLMSYIQRLEDRLAISDMPVEKKADIYDMIDNVQILVGCKVVNALEALEFLRSKISL